MEECFYEGCKHPRVKGKMYCAFHIMGYGVKKHAQRLKIDMIEKVEAITKSYKGSISLYRIRQELEDKYGVVISWNTVKFYVLELASRQDSRIKRDAYGYYYYDKSNEVDNNDTTRLNG